MYVHTPIDTYRHTYIHTYIQTDRHIYRQTDRQTDRYRQTDRHCDVCYILTLLMNPALLTKEKPYSVDMIAKQTFRTKHV